MTLLAPPPLREGPDAEALIKEARRLRRRRWLIGTSLMVLVIVSATVAITLSSRHGQSSPGLTFEAPPSLLPGRAPLAQSILVSPAGFPGTMSGGRPTELTVIDPANATHHGVQPFSSNTLETFPWVASGDDLVAVNGLQDTETIPQVGTAVAFSPTRAQSIRTLGRASYVVDAFTPGDIWLVVDPGFGGTLAADSGCTVEEVSLAGRVLVGSRSYPCDWTVDGPAPAGLLVTQASKPPALEKSPETLSIWDPASNRVEASYGYASPYLQLDGDSGNSVLWNGCNSTPCAPDNFTDLATGRTAVLPRVANGWHVDSSYVLAPNGSFAAVVAISDATSASLRSERQPPVQPCCYPGVQAVLSEVFVYNLHTDSLVESRPLTVASDLHARWSADDAYLFLTLDLQHIEAVPLWSDAASVRVSAVPGDTADAPSESFLPLATEAFR